VKWFAFAGIFLGLAVKVPLFPFHTWLPDAYETAPTGVSMVLTGTLSKMGVYGFVRLLLPLFPNEITTMAPWLLTLAVCSIVIAPLAAWAQSDLKRMVAYLSINHLGYCMLGLFAVTATAAVLGSLFTAVVFMLAMQSLFSGPLVETSIAFPDLRSNEKWVVIPVTLLMFAIGIVPQFLLNIFNSTVVQMTRLFA